MKTIPRAYLFAVFATLCWSTMASVFKLTLKAFDNQILSMLLFATLMSFFALCGILFFQRYFSFKNFSLSKGDIVSSMILGLLNPVAYYLILFKAYTLLPGQEAGTLNYTWPIALTLLSIPLLKQKIKWFHIVAICISFLGVMIISTRGQLLSLRFTNLPGAVMAVGSSFIWALYFIFNMKDKRKHAEKLCLNFFFAVLYLCILGVITKSIKMPTWKGWMGVVWIGFFEMGITYLMWLKALALSPRTSSVSNIVYLSPFISLFFLQLIVRERILAASICGLSLIVLGIIIQTRKLYYL